MEGRFSKTRSTRKNSFIDLGNFLLLPNLALPPTNLE
jgi:hypothetical protein